MPDIDPTGAVLVTAAYAMQPAGGGVQRCTREYVATLQAAGFTLHEARYEIDRRPAARLRRKLNPAPYRDLIARSFVRQAAGTIRRLRPRWVFFNQIEAAPIATDLASLRTEGVRFAMLSHGVDSSDYLHTVRVAGGDGTRPVAARDARWLGRQLFAEMEQHRHFDVVFCLSETDRLFHQWLGAPAVHVLPRLIERRPIDWHPIAGRLGTIGTLDHAPNREGIALFCRALEAAGAPARLRLIGRPEHCGRELAREFRAVEYLGGLSDEEFEAEARTWSAFVNPIFCYARGCSTKLAVPLGWQLPVATTRAGARGYWWDETLVPLAENPSGLAVLAMRLAGDPAARDNVARLAARSPQLPELAATIRAALDAACSAAPCPP